MVRRSSQRVLLLAIAAVFACGRSHHEGAAMWTVRSAPIVRNELIVGRVIEGAAVWIATGTDTLMRIDVEARTFSESRVHPLMPGEHVWGLASTAPGVFW